MSVIHQSQIIIILSILLRLSGALQVEQASTVYTHVALEALRKHFVFSAQ